jgi:site-specific DNA-cytosine methylase
VTVEEAIRDLPPPAPGPADVLGGAHLTTYLSGIVSDYAKKMRGKKEFPYNHLTRKYSPDIIATIREMQPGETWNTAAERKRLEYEPLIAKAEKSAKNSKAAIEALIERGLINTKFFKEYYWSAYTRLAWDKPALTITANANFLGSGRFTHPSEDRGITMREAARLQSFEDDFKFFTDGPESEETKNIGIGLDMIGEAVPPLLAESFAKHISILLNRLEKEAREFETHTIGKVAFR